MTNHLSESFTKANRRQWLSQFGIGIVSMLVPTHLVACDEPLPDPDQVSSDPLDQELVDYIDTLESDVVFNLLEPGKWTGIEGTHLPILTFHNQFLEVTVYTSHAMTEQHHISLHYLRDQDHNLLAAKSYSPDDRFARMTFQIPEGTTEITAYSYCNLHGLWVANGTV